MKQEEIIKLILKSEEVRDQLLALGTPKAKKTASYIDMLRKSARTSGVLEVGFLQGALIEAKEILK